MDPAPDADLDAPLQCVLAAYESERGGRAAGAVHGADIRQRVTHTLQRERNEFLARVTHELRTPFNGLMGCLDLLRCEPLSARAQEHLRLARQSAAQITTLLDDLLLLQRMEHQQLPRVVGPFEPRTVARELEQQWHELARGKGLSFGVHVAPNVPRVVVADGKALRDLLRHLVSNAVKFTERGGVMVSLRALEAMDDTLSLHVDVTDTGVGIDPSELPRLFLPFEQGHRFDTRTQGGLGLGLAIVSRLAAHLDATLGVDSAPGEGTEFFLTFPVAVVPETESINGAPEPVAPRTGLRVLLAEDNVVNQTLVVTLLHRDGHRVRVVCNGREAVEAVRHEAFDLVLMDLQMPEMDGYEATVQIRALDAARDRRTPIVALTAHGHAFEQRRCLAVGMDEFVSKPLERSALDRILSRCPTPHDVPPPQASPSPSDTSPVDVAALRARLAGRQDVLQRLIEAFREQHPPQRAALRSAVTKGNPAELRAIAHKLIGTLSCFSATEAVTLAREIEHRAMTSELVDLLPTLDALDHALEAVEARLLQLSTHGFPGVSSP